MTSLTFWQWASFVLAVYVIVAIVVFAVRRFENTSRRRDVDLAYACLWLLHAGVNAHDSWQGLNDAFDENRWKK